MVEWIDPNRMHLDLGKDSYDIVFGKDLNSTVADELEELKLNTHRPVILTDSNLIRLGLPQALQATLEEKGHAPIILDFPAGERSKNWQRAGDLLEQLADHGCGRDTVLIAFGGGVVGDMSGFIAATYTRGIPYIQIPTTVLSQADSSIGGKTGVDLRRAKNAAGAFKQPARVYVDISLLKTLPYREYVSGMAEHIKHGIIQDPSLFDFLEANRYRILERDLEALLEMSKRSLQIKGRVVEIDPHEKGLRRILNLGHTAGHAIESASGYERLHGECVSTGIPIALRIARDTIGFPAEDVQRVTRLLNQYGLPVTTPNSISDDEIIRITLLDKKAKGGKARYCLPKAIGQMHEFNGEYATPVPEEIVRAALLESR
jgi:3-dehydroquinate synthase